MIILGPSKKTLSCALLPWKPEVGALSSMDTTLIVLMDTSLKTYLDLEGEIGWFLYKGERQLHYQ